MMKIFSTILILLSILASQPAYSAANQFVHCDNCNMTKAKFRAIVSGYEGNVTVGDLETGFIASFNVVEIKRFGEYVRRATATTTSSWMRSKFDKVYVLYQTAKNNIYETTGIIESGWDAVNSPYLANRVESQITNNNSGLYQLYNDFYNQASQITGLFKPMNIKIRTPDGGFLVLVITSVVNDGQQNQVMGYIDFPESEDGNGNPIVEPGVNTRYGFSGTSDPAYSGFTSYMTGRYGWTWNSNSGGGSGSSGSTTMTCFKSGGETVCVITRIQ